MVIHFRNTGRIQAAAASNPPQVGRAMALCAADNRSSGIRNGGMELLLALGVLIYLWLMHGRVASLREDVEMMRDQLKRVTDRLSEVDKRPDEPSPTAQEAPKPAQPLAESVFEAAPPRNVPVETPKPAEPLPPTPPVPAFPLPTTAKPAAEPPKPEPVAARQAPPPPPPPIPPAPPKPKIAWEQQIGARLPVWIGGVALALSGIFLVKYSIDQGYLNPLVRCIMAGALGATMLIAAQVIAIRPIANGERIAQALSGAGIAVIYGALFAASTVYGFISPAIAFASMGANTALAVVLSLRHGQPIAILGMIGGFMTPALVGAGEPNAPVLFSYLMALTIGLFTVIRRQQWWWLLWPTLVAAFVWILLWLSGPRVPGEGLWIGIFLIMLCGASFVFVNPTAKPGESPPHAWIGLLAATAVATLLMGIVVQRSGFGLTEWGLYFALTAGTLVLAWRDQANYRFLPWISLVLSLTLLSVAPEATNFAAVTVVFAATFAVASLLFMWKARDPVEWARLACASAIAYFLLAFIRLNDLVVIAKVMYGGLPLWGIIAMAMAAAFTLVTGRALQRFGSTPKTQELLAYLAATAVAFAALAQMIELHPDYLPVGISGLMLAVAWVAARVDIMILRPAVTVVAFMVFLFLLPQLAPVFQYMTTATLGQILTLKTPALVYAPVFHLGVPAAFFAASAYVLSRKADDTIVRSFESIAVIFVGVMGYFVIRLAQTEPEKVLTTLGTGLDGAVISHVLILYAIALVASGCQWSRRALATCGLVAGAIGLARVIHFDIQPVQLLSVWLPMAFGEVSEKIVALPIATSPLFYLGIPAVLALAMRLILGRGRDDLLVRAVEYVPLALIGLMGYFLIRHAFNPLADVLTGMGSRFEGGIISQSQFVYALGLMFAAQYFKRESLINAAVIAAVIACVRIIAFDLQPFTFIAGSLRLMVGTPIEAGHTIPMAVAPVFHLGLPAILIALFSLTLRGVRERVAVALEYVAVLFVGLMGYYLIRHAFSGAENAFAAPGTYLERGVITNAILIFGVALFVLGRRLDRQSLFVSGIAATVLAVLRLGVLDYLVSSPLAAPHDVGAWPVVNALLLPYGLPVIWLLLLAQGLVSRNRTDLVPGVKSAAMISLFAWISLNVRQIFQGNFLNEASVTGNEVYAYSAAWLALGIGLLVAGAAWKDKILRFASLGVMVLAVGKVFLYDARELEGLLRVASFFGLGASLLGLSWFYTRYVFASDQPKEAAG